MLRPDTLALTALLALLTAIGPLSVDLYLPSLPEIGRALAAPPGAVQLTISAYLVGFGAGQIVYGPLADRHGRKPVMLASLLIFCIATLVCAGAPSIAALIGARFVQAFAASAPTWRSWRPATPDCSLSSRARPSCCRSCMGSPLSASACRSRPPASAM